MIRIEEVNYGDHQEVIVPINHCEVISMNNNIEGKWGVSSSAILRWDFDKAEEILECYNQVFERVRRIKDQEFLLDNLSSQLLQAVKEQTK